MVAFFHGEHPQFDLNPGTRSVNALLDAMAGPEVADGARVGPRLVCARHLGGSVDSGAVLHQGASSPKGR
eukprot:581299-Rhodomonas_salina.2